MDNPAVIKEKLDMILPKEGKQTIVPFIHGAPGIGKSAIIKQIAEERSLGVIDLRLSQHESSDIKGIPFPCPEENICKWLPPEFLPFKTTKKYDNTKGILFLDEINRAPSDVLQTIFQLVLDRQVGNLELIDEWHIVCAGNLGDEDNCDVIELDSALNNRFIHLWMETDLPSWVPWAEKNKVNEDIISFLKGKPAYLYRKCKDKSDREMLLTPRSWEKFSDIIEQNADLGIKKVTESLSSNIIFDAAIQFMKYLEEKTLVEPKDILNKYDEIKNKLAVLAREQKYAINQELVHYIASMKRIEKKHLENLHRYLNEELEMDIHLALLKEIAKKTDTPNNDGFIDKYLDAYKDECTKVIDIIAKNNEKKE